MMTVLVMMTIKRAVGKIKLSNRVKQQHTAESIRLCGVNMRRWWKWNFSIIY